MTAKEQLELARAHGHELYVRTTGPWPEHGDPHPKYWLSCSCGWEAHGVSRTKAALNGRMVRHLSRAIAEAVDQGAKN